VQWFLDNGAEPDLRCAVDETVLSYAVWLAPLDIIKLLIAHVPDRRPQQGELLHRFAMRFGTRGNHAELLALLLSCTSFQVNVLQWRKDVYSRCFVQVLGAGTPLHYTALYDSPMAAAALLDAGASVAIRDDNGDTPIEIARRLGHEAVLEVLQKAGEKEGRIPKSVM
jgi:ankyrin repeat protein